VKLILIQTFRHCRNSFGTGRGDNGIQEEDDGKYYKINYMNSV